VIEVTDRVPGERARLVVKGQRTDDDSTCTVVVIQECSGTWAIHGLGNPGVRLSAADTVALGEAILERGPGERNHCFSRAGRTGDARTPGRYEPVAGLAFQVVRRNNRCQANTGPRAAVSNAPPDTALSKSLMPAP
jgi:hypothetical protein